MPLPASLSPTPTTTFTTTTTIATITTTIPPPAKLAHVYANIHANSTMLKPAGGERLVHSGGSIHDDLHSQYSLIAVVILTTLFLTITVSTTGLLLAFCKKKNTVFSLQKSEQDSQFEMDDLENTDTESCHEDVDVQLPAGDSASQTSSGRGGKRSVTFPVLHATLREEREGKESEPHSQDAYGQCYSHHPHATTDSPTANTPLVCRQYRRHDKAACGGRTKDVTNMCMRHSQTVEAIHHSDGHIENSGESGIRILVEDMDSKDDLPETSLGHLAIKLEQDSDSDLDDNSGCQGYYGYHDSDPDPDDSQSDQTVALLRC